MPDLVTETVKRELTLIAVAQLVQEIEGNNT